MPLDLSYLEGRRFCVVLVKADEADPENGPIQLKCLHGRANILAGCLTLENAHGHFTVPTSCCNQILPNDGTEMLRDAEYFVFCRVSGLDL